MAAEKTRVYEESNFEKGFYRELTFRVKIVMADITLSEEEGSSGNDRGSSHEGRSSVSLQHAVVVLDGDVFLALLSFVSSVKLF